jgi:hypothetical protein
MAVGVGKVVERGPILHWNERIDPLQGSAG